MTYNESQIRKYGWPKKNNQQPRDKKKLIQDKKRNDKYLHQ